MRAYCNMKSRIKGIQKKKAHLYEGLALLDKQDFYVWAKESRVFLDLFTIWVNSGYERKLTPSIDRIDSNKGYTLDNMQWLTHSDNSSKGAKNK